MKQSLLLDHTVLWALAAASLLTGAAVAFPFQVVMGDARIDIIDVFYFDDEGKVVDMKAYWGPENFNA